VGGHPATPETRAPSDVAEPNPLPTAPACPAARAQDPFPTTTTLRHNPPDQPPPLPTRSKSAGARRPTTTEGAAGAGAGGSMATEAQLRSLEASLAGQAKDGAAQVRSVTVPSPSTHKTPTTRYASSVTPGCARLPAGRVQVVWDLRALRGQDVYRIAEAAAAGAGGLMGWLSQRSVPAALAAVPAGSPQVRGCLLPPLEVRYALRALSCPSQKSPETGVPHPAPRPVQRAGMRSSGGTDGAPETQRGDATLHHSVQLSTIRYGGRWTAPAGCCGPPTRAAPVVCGR